MEAPADMESEGTENDTKSFGDGVGGDKSSDVGGKNSCEDGCDASSSANITNSGSESDGGRAEEEKTCQERETARSEKLPSIKPLEELSEADIMQLTREDCRRYLKEKGMRRPSWNKSQAIQQVLALKSLFGSKAQETESCQEDKCAKSIPDVTKGTSATSTEPATDSHHISGRKRSSAMFEWTQDLSGSLPAGQSTRFVPNAKESTYRSAGSTESGIPFPGQQGGFGSHFPVQWGMMRGSPGAMRPSENIPRPTMYQQPQVHPQAQAMQHSMHPQYVSEYKNMGAFNQRRPKTAQLTIFYSGTVNVYDDVSPDRAQAIMLLAGGGNLEFTNRNLNHRPNFEMQQYPSHPILAGSSIPNGTHARPANVPVMHSSNPPLVPNMAFNKSIMFPGNPAGFNRQLPYPGVLAQQPARCPQTELPQGRKISIQHFLAKRKERVQAREAYKKMGIDNPCFKEKFLYTEQILTRQPLSAH